MDICIVKIKDNYCYQQGKHNIFLCSNTDHILSYKKNLSSPPNVSSHTLGDNQTPIWSICDEHVKIIPVDNTGKITNIPLDEFNNIKLSLTICPWIAHDERFPNVKICEFSKCLEIAEYAIPKCTNEKHIEDTNRIFNQQRRLKNLSSHENGVDLTDYHICSGHKSVLYGYGKSKDWVIPYRLFKGNNTDSILFCSQLNLTQKQNFGKIDYDGGNQDADCEEELDELINDN